MKKWIASLALVLLLISPTFAGEPFPATPLEFKVIVDLDGSYGKSIFTVKGVPVPYHTW